MRVFWILWAHAIGINTGHKSIEKSCISEEVLESMDNQWDILVVWKPRLKGHYDQRIGKEIIGKKLEKKRSDKK